MPPEQLSDETFQISPTGSLGGRLCLLANLGWLRCPGFSLPAPRTSSKNSVSLDNHILISVLGGWKLWSYWVSKWRPTAQWIYFWSILACKNISTFSTADVWYLKKQKTTKHKHVNDELLLMCLSAQFRPHVFVTKSHLTDKDGSKPEDKWGDVRLNS